MPSCCTHLMRYWLGRKSTENLCMAEKSSELFSHCFYRHATSCLPISLANLTIRLSICLVSVSLSHVPARSFSLVLLWCHRVLPSDGFSHGFPYVFPMVGDVGGWTDLHQSNKAAWAANPLVCCKGFPWSSGKNSACSRHDNAGNQQGRSKHWHVTWLQCILIP